MKKYNLFHNFLKFEKQKSNVISSRDNQLCYNLIDGLQVIANLVFFSKIV